MAMTAISGHMAIHVADARAAAEEGAEAELPRMSETALCELALRGRRDAWNVLIRRHDHRVLVSLLARGLPIERAKELAQDAWTRLIEQQREGRLSHLSLPGLAITQAGYLALDELRRPRRMAEAATVSRALEDVPDPEAGAEERMLGREQLRRAQDALRRCAPSAQAVFRILYENPSMSHAEAAQQVGLSLQRVRQILCEVRKKLRVALEDEST